MASTAKGYVKGIIRTFLHLLLPYKQKNGMDKQD